MFGVHTRDQLIEIIIFIQKCGVIDMPWAVIGGRIQSKEIIDRIPLSAAGKLYADRGEKRHIFPMEKVDGKVGECATVDEEELKICLFGR